MKKVNTIHMTELLSKTDNIYKNVMISAKRARQIISDNFIDIEVLENADNLEELEKVENNHLEPSVFLRVQLISHLFERIGFCLQFL